MLRRTFIKTCAALSLCAALPAMAFTEDADFVALEKPIADWQGFIVKIWSYDCPFCYKYDAGVDPKVLPAAEKATGLPLRMIHLETKGKYGRAASEFLAMCELLDKAAGKTVHDKESLYKKAKDAWYQAYHKKGERWASGEEAFLKTAFDATGITAEDFAAQRKTDEVVKLADSWKVSYDVAKIQGVPAYVVNGKWLVMTKSIRGFKGFESLLTELAAK